MAYTPPAYNMVTINIKPTGSMSVIVPPYNDVVLNMSLVAGAPTDTPHVPQPRGSFMIMLTM